MNKTVSRNLNMQSKYVTNNFDPDTGSVYVPYCRERAFMGGVPYKSAKEGGGGCSFKCFRI